jgi:hypothetical protein
MLGTTGMPFDDDMLSARGVRFAVGAHYLEFLMPTDAQSPLVAWMREYGPSPYAATLLGGSGTAALLDLGLTHGANISFGT